MNKLIISIFTLLIVAVGAVAQTATVTGTVTDDYGPVIGATVIVQGTTIGCTTDLDGKFSLANVPNVDKAVLKISFVGMEEVKEQVIKEQREGFFASSIEFIKRIIGKEGSYMEKKYSKKY